MFGETLDKSGGSVKINQSGVFCPGERESGGHPLSGERVISLSLIGKRVRETVAAALAWNLM
jgi:hypothetical protein